MILKICKFLFVWAFVIPLLVAVVITAGCALPKSPDPEIAVAQDWAGMCAQMDQGIQTGLSLGKAGVLDDTEKEVINEVRNVYEPICTGAPMPLGDTVKNIAVSAAVSRLCPELKTVSEDLVLTISQAATCAARKALTIYILEKQA